MDNSSHIDREKLRIALEQITRGIAMFHRDVGLATEGQTYWIFAIMVMVVANFIQGSWDLGGLASFGLSFVLVSICGVVHGIKGMNRARKHLKEPLEPMWSVKVDL